MTAPTDFPMIVQQPGLLDGPGGDLLIQVIAGLVVAGLAFAFGFNRGQTVNNYTDNSVNIYNIIADTSRQAMAAGSDQLRSRTLALRAAINEYLGPVILVGAGIGGPVKAMDEALKGEVKETPKPKPDDGTGHGGKKCECKANECECAPASASAANVTINQVYVGGLPVTQPVPCGCSEVHRPGCEHDENDTKAKKDDAKPEKRDMTHQEQVEALAKSVRQFNDYWSQKDDRIRELRRARAALVRHIPSTTTPTSDSARRGWRFGD